MSIAINRIIVMAAALGMAAIVITGAAPTGAPVGTPVARALAGKALSSARVRVGAGAFLSRVQYPHRIVTIPAGCTTYLCNTQTVNCPPGTKAIGGGYDQNDQSLVIIGSHPDTRKASGPAGWTVRVQNTDTANAHVLGVYAVCSVPTAASVQYRMSAETISAPIGSAASPTTTVPSTTTVSLPSTHTLTCPGSAQRLLGGGYDENDASLTITSNRPNKAAWLVGVQNTDTTNSHLLTVYTVCTNAAQSQIKVQQKSQTIQDLLPGCAASMSCPVSPVSTPGCPAGMQAIGGGYGVNNQNVAAIIGSRPDAAMDARWSIVVQLGNKATPSDRLDLYTICATSA